MTQFQAQMRAVSIIEESLRLTVMRDSETAELERQALRDVDFQDVEADAAWQGFLTEASDDEIDEAYTEHMHHYYA